MQNIMPLPKGIPKPTAHDYVRVIDRGAPDGLPGEAEEFVEPDW